MAEKKSSISGFFREQVLPLVVIIAVFLALRSSLVDWNDVPTGSMRPSIIEGDRILVNKVAYDLKVPFTTWRLASWSDPQRGDVVVFFAPGSGTRMVKRVVGLPGDTVALRGGELIVNGTPASYGDLDERILTHVPEEERRGLLFLTEQVEQQGHPVSRMRRWVPNSHELAPMRVPEGQFFLMGDNRDNSEDSRVWGPVPREQIVGRASRVIISLDSGNRYMPRGGRFLMMLP